MARRRANSTGGTGTWVQGTCRARGRLPACYRIDLGPDNFADLGTGDGSPDAEGRAFVDLWVVTVTGRACRALRCFLSLLGSDAYPDPNTPSFPWLPSHAAGLAHAGAIWRPSSAAVGLNDFFAVRGELSLSPHDADKYSGRLT